MKKKDEIKMISEGAVLQCVHEVHYLHMWKKREKVA